MAKRWTFADRQRARARKRLNKITDEAKVYLRTVSKLLSSVDLDREARMADRLWFEIDKKVVD